MKININQQCTVILTETGVKEIEKYYKYLGLKPFKEYHAGDTYTEELWNIMSVFGRCLSNGLSVPFNTTIEIHDNKY